MASPKMYREDILERYKKPKNRGKIENPDSEAHESNPLCGDEISISLKVNGGKIEDAKFDGTSCAICTAACDMLLDEVKGKSLEGARKFSNEEMLALLGIDPGPARIKCALLSLKVLKLAIYKKLAKEKNEGDG